MTKETCVVCLEPTANAVRPCHHAVCETCIDAWLARGHPTCPTCRGTLVAARVVPIVPLRGTVHLDVDGAKGAHAGLTLACGLVPGSVVVKCVMKTDRGAASGMRPGDVITHLNGMPVHDHASAVAVVDRATDLGTSLVCTVARRSRPWWKRLLFLA